jgi:hypothetical protein
MKYYKISENFLNVLMHEALMHQDCFMHQGVDVNAGVKIGLNYWDDFYKKDFNNFNDVVQMVVDKLAVNELKEV